MAPSRQTLSTGNVPIKANLAPAPGEYSNIPTIEFMFNPTQITFERVVETANNPGARFEKSGTPKISFSNIQPYKVTISNIIFDTYENSNGLDRNVVTRYIEKFRKAVEFISDEEKRPPIYTFSWGTEYLRYCFITTLTYKLTMFLPDGTPVRAVIDSLTLTETDGIPSGQSQPPSALPNPNDTMDARKKQNRR